MPQTTEHIYFDSPVGSLKLSATREALSSIHFAENKNGKLKSSTDNKILEAAKNQLAEYFNRNRQTFDIPLAPEGTDFELQVWGQIKTIPYGSTATYSEIAKRLGDVNKVRAVGKANGQNPISIIIPCHRIIGTNNKLTGYAGGIERKRWLLQHEGALLL